MCLGSLPKAADKPDSTLECHIPVESLPGFDLSHNEKTHFEYNFY